MDRLPGERPVGIAPVLAGGGPRVLGDLDTPLELLHLRAEPSGEDVLVEGYLHEP